ncbi:MAG: 2-amino-4-hydroxy-6-hydroxymethyldihydropteridine diphosphokinase [Phycisphaera sp.]|nr:2-amino-4-hydroxy-6-hydroxymethyldihydropteridine diphosphokinase [Phycisphaera sp.]
MAKAYLGLGSNLGDRRAHLDLAEAALSELPDSSLLAFSSIYETEPVGPQSQGKYLNAAAVIETALSPRLLLKYLRDIEGRCGREDLKTRIKWGPRTLDIDILLYDNRVVSDDDLVIPHPLMHDRLFVLKPLAEIASRAVHPILEMTVGDLLRELENPTR